MEVVSVTSLAMLLKVRFKLKKKNYFLKKISKISWLKMRTILDVVLKINWKYIYMF